MTAHLSLRAGPTGDPLISATFVLARPPGLDERLTPLVERAVLALELQAEPGDDRRWRDVAFEVRRGDPPRLLGEAVATGPFGHAAVPVTATGDDARALLEAVLAGHEEVALRATLTAEPPPGQGSTVRLAVGEIWRTLDAVADESRHFHRAELLHYLRLLRTRGAVVGPLESSRDRRSSPTVLEPEVPDAVLLDLVLRGARLVLSPVSDYLEPDPAAAEGHADLGPVVVLSRFDPGDLEVVLDLPAAAVAAPVETVQVPLARVVGEVVARDPARYLHMVTAGGGRLDSLLPARRAGRSRAPAGPVANLHVALGGRLVAPTAALAPAGPASRPPIFADRISSHSAVLMHSVVADLAIVGPVRTPGPLVTGTDDALWADRWDDAARWYLPEFSVVVPDPTAGDDASPFCFDVDAAGHTLDGTVALDAAVHVTLAAGPSHRTTAQFDAVAEGRTLRPVAVDAVRVHLAIPFRDERGTARTELVEAETVERSGGLGTMGSTLRARFRLRNAWARMAYGACAVAGFQTEPARVVVTSTFSGWRRTANIPVLVGVHKRWSLAGNGSRGRAGAGLRAPVLAHASVRPAWQQPTAASLDLLRPSHEWVDLSVARATDLVMPCGEHGRRYRQRVDGEWRAIGCQPVLQLGQTEHRTYEEVTVRAAAGRATVLRSLTGPRRFLVVPRSYAVGRYEADQGGRAFHPTLLLHSTIDVDDPTNIRCVLAASLQPVLPPFVRSAIVAELRATLDPEATLEYLPACGVEPDIRWAVPGGTAVEGVLTDSGFSVVLSTDVPGFLALRSLLERSGIEGSASATLPGGLTLRTTLRLDLATVTGPFGSGPVTVDGSGATRTLTNRTGQRQAVSGLATAGTQVVPLGLVLEPNGSATVDVPAASGDLDVVHQPDTTAEPLDEARAYIEDLELGVVFLAATDPAAGGLAALEVATALDGRTDAAPLVLTSRQRQAERTYTLPLTTFARDPAVTFTVTSVGEDGSRTTGPSTTWPVRSRGVLIPVSPPGPPPVRASGPSQRSEPPV